MSTDTGSDTLYTEFFGFSERPFTLVPDPGFLFWSEQHRRAYSVLLFGVMSRAPITLITGEVGSGKTTLLQQLLSELDDSVTVGLISNAQGGRGELLQWVLNAFSIPFTGGEDYVPMFQRLLEFLISEYAAGRRAALIIDEAQNLSSEGLEELRLLTNINTNKDEILQLILVGQPELRDIVLAPNMRQLAQRVATGFHLGKMDEETVSDYIAHRLKVVGGSGDEVTMNARRLIHASTGGVPRLVNQLCELALLYAWAGESRVVDSQAVQEVLDDGAFFSGPADAPPRIAEIGAGGRE
jgi:type II secretory pathway predicted ATPase ExeA